MGKSISGKELGKGITQRKDGLYQARFINRFGKRQTLYAKTYSEITKKLRDEQYQDDRQTNVVDNNMTLDEWYNIWIDTCKVHCRDTTKSTYCRRYNRLREDLGWRKLTSLNLVVIQKTFNELKSDESRRDCKTVLVDILNRAVESDLLVRNVAVSVNTKIENREVREKRILSQSEIQLLYEYSRNGRLYPIFVVALNTGMRIGEITALTWDCVDFQNGIIRVEKTLCYIPSNGKGFYEFHPPKSTAGKRCIPMTKMVRDVLLEQKAWHDNVATRFKPIEGFEDLVFTGKTNRPTNLATIKDGINRLVEKINAENAEIEFEHFTPHCLRHTFATICIERGMRPKTLQKLLGHNSLRMTMDLYCHVTDDSLKDEMSAIAEMV